MSLIKHSLAIACICLTASAAHASKTSPSYSCPAELTIQAAKHPLQAVEVFSGPIEDRASLVPELSADNPSLALWPQSDGPLSFVQCKYQGIKHYIVLNIEGVQSCQARITKDGYNSLSCQ